MEWINKDKCVIRVCLLKNITILYTCPCSNFQKYTQIDKLLIYIIDFYCKAFSIKMWMWNIYSCPQRSIKEFHFIINYREKNCLKCISVMLHYSKSGAHWGVLQLENPIVWALFQILGFWDCVWNPAVQGLTPGFCERQFCRYTIFSLKNLIKNFLQIDTLCVNFKYNLRFRLNM